MWITILIFVAILSVLIFVHELGHFITARKSGMGVEEFGFGFPPRIFGIKRKGIIYSINLIPIGGFVKILGENGEEKNNPKSFARRPIWQRALVLVAGVSMNMILAIIALFVAFEIGLPQALEGNEKNVSNQKVQIVQILKNSPAEQAGIKVGDEVLKMNKKDINSVVKFQDLTKKLGGKKTSLTIRRDGKEEKIKITPRKDPPVEEGPLGVAIVETGIVEYHWYESLWKGFVTTFTFAGMIIMAFYDIIKNLIISKPIGVELSGPIGIAVLTHEMTKLGFVYILQFIAILSINLAIINILPLPALDGGRLLFLAIEAIRRKPVTQKIENLVHTIGFGALMLLMVAVTFRDVVKFKDIFINLWNRIIG